MRASLARLAISAMLAGLVGCGESPRSDPDVAAAPRSAGASQEEVATEHVQRGEISGVITATGSIRAQRSTPLGPAVPGRIIHIFVHEGDEVLAGAPVFQIDPGPYAIALRSAESGLALARAELDEARGEAVRSAKLSNKRMVSDQGHHRAKTRKAVALAHVEQAEAQVEGARYDLHRTLVLAPYAGTIVERAAHEGVMGVPSPQSRIVVLQESGALEAVLNIPEAADAVVRRDDPARLLFDHLPRPLESRVQSVSARIDAQSRTYAVRVPVDDGGGRIKAGAFVRAEISPRPHAEALLIDRRALARQEGGTYVFRVRQSVAERVPVRIGIQGRNQVEILSGLEEGDEVVVGHVVSRLTDGTRVRTSGSTSARIRDPLPVDAVDSVDAGEAPRVGRP